MVSVSDVDIIYIKIWDFSGMSFVKIYFVDEERESLSYESW